MWYERDALTLVIYRRIKRAGFADDQDRAAAIAAAVRIMGGRKRPREYITILGDFR